jgi:integrase
MVWACDFPDIDSSRDDRFICENKKDACDGRLEISKTHIVREHNKGSMSQPDIYNRARQLERINEHIKESIKSGSNRKNLKGFETWLFSQGLSIARIARYLECMSWTAGKCNDTNLKNFDREQIVNLLKTIEAQDWEEWTKYSYKTTIRKFLNFLGRKDLLELVKANPPKKKKLPEELLTKADIEKMINAAEHPRDKALIALLYESGARISEVALMNIKNITFDELGAVVVLANGKTGMRRIRVVYSASYLRQWIDVHPLKSDREAPLWINIWAKKVHKPLQYLGFRKALVEAAQKAGINKRVHLHLTRHSRATHLAEHMTEQQMKNYLGWTAGSSMASVYVHLSGKDLDNAVLKMYGMQKEEDMVDTMKPDHCPRCKELNPKGARFCFKCGMPLDRNAAKEIQEKSQMIPEVIAALQNTPEFQKLFAEAIAKATRV